MEKYHIAFYLLANARAFLESAVADVRLKESDKTRFAILHLVTALELLLKARIALIDPAMLVVGKRVTDDQFERGEFRSVGMEEAIGLLTQRNHLVLNDRHVKQLAALRRMRNRVTHFVPAIGSVEARAAIGAGIHLFIEIHRAGFADDDVHRAKAITAIVEELTEFREFVEERLNEVTPCLATAERPRTRHFDECVTCRQDAAVIEGNYLKCIFCGTTDMIARAAERLSADGTVEQCPECRRMSVAHHRRKGEEPTCECFCCGYFSGPELAWSDGKNSIPRLRY